MIINLPNVFYPHYPPSLVCSSICLSSPQCQIDSHSRIRTKHFSVIPVSVFTLVDLNSSVCLNDCLLTLINLFLFFFICLPVSLLCGFFSNSVPDSLFWDFNLVLSLYHTHLLWHTASDIITQTCHLIGCEFRKICRFMEKGNQILIYVFVCMQCSMYGLCQNTVIT